MAEYQNFRAKYSLELLTDYVSGLLDSETCARIEADIEASEELASMVDGLRIMVETGYDDFDRVEQELESSAIRVSALIEDKQGSSKQRSFWGYAYKIAAVLLLVFVPLGLFYYYQINSFDYLLDEELGTYYASPVVVRGGSDQELWDSAAYFYQQEDFESAVDLLSKYMVSNPEDTQALYYIGISYIYQSKSELAIPHLDAVINSQSRLRQQARWFKALALLDLGQKDSGLQILKGIADNSNAYKSASAKVLIDSLSD